MERGLLGTYLTRARPARARHSFWQVAAVGSVNLDQTKDLAIYWMKAQPTVAAFVSSLIPDFHQAEDVLHEVAMAIVRKFEEYDTQQPFLNWAIGIARFEVLRHRRQYVTDKHQFSDNLVGIIGAAYEQLSEELDGRRESLRDCLQEAQGRSREALRLRYVDGLRLEEIAKRLGMAHGAARVLLHRTRTALKACIERRLQAEEARS